MDMKLMQKMLADMKKNKQLLENRMKEIKETEFSSNTGQGLFKLTMNGNFEVLRCEIDDKVVGDKETLEDLIITSVTEVVAKINGEMKKLEKDFLPKNLF